MCVQTKYPRSRRTKSTRRSSNPNKQNKASKHLKTNHNCSSSSSTFNHDSSSSSLDCSSRSRKAVTFSEVVNVRPHHEQKRSRAQPQAPPKKKKSVSFHEVVMVRPVLHLADYTDQEMYATWFVLEDKQQIKADILNTLKLVRDGKFQGCTRGLEKLSDGGRTRERRLISMREVLEEQDNQRKLHKSKNGSPSDIVYDLSKFRRAYKPHSRAARHVAHAVGKIDEMTAACQRVEIPAFGRKK